MEKVKQWIAELLKQSISAQKLQWHIQEGKGEGYEIVPIKGKLRVRASSPLAATYAFHQIEVYHKANHFAECLGKTDPRYPLRPIWLQPGLITPANIETLCQKTIALGANSWIVGNFFEGMYALDPIQRWPIKDWCALLHSYGLKLFVKPQFQRAFGYSAVCPMDTSYCTEVENMLKQWLQEVGKCDGLFWECPHLESGFENALAARDCLHGEVVLHDLKMVEKALGNKDLIFYLPVRTPSDASACAPWMGSLCDSAGFRTKIAFSAVAGNFYDDHLPSHPFWNELRASQDCSATQILPIVNGGSITQGEGLWPGLAQDLFQEYIAKCYRHPFAGIIIPAYTLPNKGTFLEGSLWIGSQAQWSVRTPEVLADTWLSAYRFSESKEILALIRCIIKEISYLRSIIQHTSRPTEIKSRIEKTIASFKYLESTTSDLADYYPFFAKDGKRFLGQFARHLGVPTPHLLPTNAPDDCFWSDTSYENNQWRRSHPRRGDKGSRMETILKDNGFDLL